MLGRTRRIHFVGMEHWHERIAELLANLGYEVSGSDARQSDVTDRLVTMGVRMATGHDAAKLGAADVVVVYFRDPVDNAEVRRSGATADPVILGGMLAELMRLRYGIGSTGTPREDDDDFDVGVVLERAGLDPTA